MRILIITVLFLVFIGCADQPDVNGGRNFIGVHGILSPKLRNQELYLSRTYNLDQYSEYAPDTLSIKLSGAYVTVTCDTQTVVFTEISPGYYVDTAGVLQVISEQTYILDVRSASGERLSAVTTAPGVPELLPGSFMDTLRINYELDTTFCGRTCTENTKLNNSPISFQWANTAQDGSYFFQIAKDTTTIINQNYGNQFITGLTLLSSRGFEKDNFIVLFKTTNLYQDNFRWSWAVFTTNENNIIETALEIQIRAHDKGLTDWDSKTGSNVYGGYGFFGSMSFYKRPIYVIQTGIIVR